MISIIIPVYNVENYLRKCLNSIQNQTIEDFEVILVDDGSTDLSGLICNEYQEKDPRFKTIHQHNQGVSAARNMGLSKASGEYISFVDADDYIHPLFLETLFHAMEQTGCEVSSVKGLIVHNYQEPKESDIPSPQILCQELIIEKMFQNSTIDIFYLVLWNKMYTKKVIEGLQFKNIVSEDGEFNLRVYLRVDKLAYVECPLYYYMQHRTSLTHKQQKSKRIVDEIQTYHIYLDTLLKDKPRYRAYCIEKLVKRLINVRHHMKNTKYETYAKSTIEKTKAKYINEFKRTTFIPKKKKFVLLLFIKSPSLYTFFLWIMEKYQNLLNRH